MLARSELVGRAEEHELSVVHEPDARREQ